MSELAIRMPITALGELRALVVPEAREGDCLVLSIRTDCENLSLRDMAAYLELVDHVYGRLQPGGFRSYAMRPGEHLRVEQVRTGSVELLITEVLKAASPLTILWLCLRYIPPALESVAKTFDSTQQGLLARENRKEIRRRMEQDEKLAGLPRERLNDLVALEQAVISKDQTLVPRAFRFSEEHVVDVDIRAEKPDDAS